MRNILTFCLPVLVAIAGFSSCAKESDPIPVNQEIVTVDSTLVTGELTVVVKYLKNGSVLDAPGGTLVRLFATYEDLENGLDIYDLTSTGNSAYFGFINYGTYYVKAEATIGSVNYWADNAVQVRPNRFETLTITMLP